MALVGSALQFVGATLITLGIGLVHVPTAVISGGVFVMVFGITTELGRPDAG